MVATIWPTAMDTGFMARHEGPPQPWVGRWLGWTFGLLSLAVVLLIPAYRIGDPLEDTVHPMAEILGQLGYFCVFNAVVVGGTGLLTCLRARRRRAERGSQRPKVRR